MPCSAASSYSSANRETAAQTSAAHRTARYRCIPLLHSAQLSVFERAPPSAVFPRLGTTAPTPRTPLLLVSIIATQKKAHHRLPPAQRPATNPSPPRLTSLALLCCSAVERLLQFVANLASFSNDKYASDSELAVDLLEQIIPLTKAKDKAVRFRTCQLTSKLLNSLGEDAEVSDEFYENILNAMLLRLRDKIPVVRVHAASAISRLQDPTDPEDPVTLEYLRMIANDTSKEVRKSVLANIGISTVTLPAILARIRYVSAQKT